MDLCATVLALALMTIIYLPSTSLKNADSCTFGDSYLQKQSTAIAKRERGEYNDEDASVSFNEKGNVSQAQTITKGSRQIVIELGGGRLVYRS